jgi:hypothetical protein
VGDGPRTIRDLTLRASVLDAIAEYDRLGGPEFLDHYGYGRGRYLLRHKNKLYESKAIAGVAWGLQHFDDPQQRPETHFGGAQTTVRTLKDLRFKIVERDPANDPPRLKDGRTYTWDELGELFRFKPRYLETAGGMVSRPEQDSLILITHFQEGRSFSYGDEWDGDELIYAGKGLTGDQVLKGENLFVAENSRVLLLFEYAGPHRLRFHSRVHCVETWETVGFDKNRRERRVYRFRLRPLRRKGGGQRRRRKATPDTPPPSERERSSFTPRPFDPDRTPSQRRRATPADPESQNVLNEQADQDHQSTLSRFGLWLEGNGWSDLEEIDGAIDLLAKSGSRRVLFEIKSIRRGGERARVRAGLAQLLEYRLFLGKPTDKLCLVSNRPISERRLLLLDSLSIGHVYLDEEAVNVSGTRASRALFPRHS